MNFAALFVTVVVIMSNPKFGCVSYFSCNFFNKAFANVLFFPRPTHFTETTSRTSGFLLSATILSSLFSGVAFNKYVSKQEISIGRCPTNVSLSPDLKTPIAFLSHSIVSFTHQILSNIWYPNVFVNMGSRNSCLELNFIIQFIRCWQYSRHMFLLKFYPSEVNVLQSLNGIFVM